MTLPCTIADREGAASPSAAADQQSAIAFAPRWTFRAVFAGIVLSVGVFLLLPCLEMLGKPPAADTLFRPVNTAVAPPPLPLPRKRSPTEREPQRARNRPKPKLQQMQRRLMPLQVAMDLDAALGDVGGDFDLAFQVDTPGPAARVEDLVFELLELDEPPRPLARLHPIYPTRARMRNIEGLVVLEFVVLSDGTTRSIEIIACEPSGVFENAAIRAVESWRFTPGTKAGKPVAVRVRQKMTFKLD